MIKLGGDCVLKNYCGATVLPGCLVVGHRGIGWAELGAGSSSWHGRPIFSSRPRPRNKPMGLKLRCVRDNAPMAASINKFHVWKSVQAQHAVSITDTAQLEREGPSESERGWNGGGNVTPVSKLVSFKCCLTEWWWDICICNKICHLSPRYVCLSTNILREFERSHWAGHNRLMLP